MLAALVAMVDVVLIYLVLTSVSFIIHHGISWSTRLPLASKITIVAILAGAGFAFVLPILAALVWKKSCWTRLERLHYWLVTVAALFVSGVSFAWNLVKWPL